MIRMVGKGKYYEEPIAWAKDQGITTGKNATTFGVGEDVTRQDFILFLYRYAKYKNYDVSVKNSNAYLEKTDASKVSKYAREAINWGVERGFIGNNRPDMMPTDNIKRKDVAVIIARFLKMYDETDDYYYSDLTDYSINYVLDGGKNSRSNPNVYKTVSENITLADPVKVDAIFKGWYSDKELKNKVTKIEKGSYGDITLYAKWEAHEYTKKEAISKLYDYMMENGTEIDSTRRYIEYRLSDTAYYRIYHSAYDGFYFEFKNTSNSTTASCDYGQNGYSQIDVRYDCNSSEQLWASYSAGMYMKDVSSKLLRETLSGRGVGFNYDQWDLFAQSTTTNLFIFTNLMLNDIGLTIQDLGFTSWDLK